MIWFQTDASQSLMLSSFFLYFFFFKLNNKLPEFLVHKIRILQEAHILRRLTATLQTQDVQKRC